MSLYLITGECPCVDSCRTKLRSCHLSNGSSYKEINRYDYHNKVSKELFEAFPKLYKFDTCVLFNTDTKRFINIAAVNLDQSVRKDIASLVAGE